MRYNSEIVQTYTLAKFWRMTMKVNPYFVYICVLFAGFLFNDTALYGQRNRQPSRPAQNARENIAIEQVNKTTSRLVDDQRDEIDPYMSEASLRGIWLLEDGKYDAAQKIAEILLEEATSVTHARYLHELGSAFNKQAHYSEAESLMIRVIEIRGAELGMDHPDMGPPLHNLAEVYRKQGRYVEAEPLYKWVLDMVRDKTSSDTTIILNNLALLYAAHGRYEEAEPFYKRMLEFRETEYGMEHSQVASSLNNLALLYAAQNRNSESESFHKRALKIREDKLGKDHATTATTLNNLAELYLKQSRYAEAELLLKRALNIRETKLDKYHPDIATTLDNLAILYQVQSRSVEAEPLVKRSLEIKAKNLRKEPSDGEWLNRLATVFVNANHITAITTAELLFKRSLEIEENVAVMNKLCMIYQFNGHYAKAESLLKHAISIHETRFGNDHSDTAALLRNLAVTIGQQDRYAEATSFAMRSLEICEIQRVKNHLEIADSLSTLANCYYGLGNYIEAEPLIMRALKTREEMTFGKNDIRTAFLLNNLAGLYTDQGRYSEAETQYIQALEICEMTVGKDHLWTANIQSWLAEIYIEQGRYSEAEILLKRALITKETQIGKDHQQVAIQLDCLGMLYFKQGRYTEAEEHFKLALKLEKPDGLNSSYMADHLATLYYKQKRHVEAEPLYDQAIVVFNTTTMAPYYGQIWYCNRANLYKATARPDKAVTDLKRAMDLSLEIRKHASGSDEHRAQTFAQYYPLFEVMVTWQHELGDMNEAYEAMERSRAQGLQDLINSSHIDLLEGVSPETAKKLRDAENAALSDVASFERQLELQPNNEKLKESLKLAREKLVEAMAAIRSASPAYRLMIAEDRKPVAFEIVQKEFDAAKTLVLEYLIGEENSYVLLYGFNIEPTLQALELNELHAELFCVEAGPLTAKKLQSILQNENNDGVLQLVTKPEKDGVPTQKTLDKLAVLWHLLVPEESMRTNILDGKSFARLLVLPDGALARLPFEMLVVEPDAANPQYLLDKGPIVVYAPSASMYYNLSRRTTETKTIRRTLTVGNPDYTVKRTVKPSNSIAEMHNSRRAAKLRILLPLPGTERETAWVEESSRKNNISVTRLNQLQATEANIRKNTAGCQIVHLACHGLAEDDFGNAMFSSLAVTIGDPNDPKNDGFLDLAEMFGLDLKSCELAVLSACDTNLGPNQHGEGTWSMGRGMLASGAKRVVTTNWQVADDASALLVYFFIDKINKSISESSEPDHAAALRQAKREIRNDRENPRWQHPYYWAPFVLIGPN